MDMSRTPTRTGIDRSVVYPLFEVLLSVDSRKIRSGSKRKKKKKKHQRSQRSAINGVLEVVGLPSYSTHWMGRTKPLLAYEEVFKSHLVLLLNEEINTSG